MSRFSIGIDYDGRLWDTDDASTGESVNWSDFTIHVGHGNISLSTRFELDAQTKINLLSCLANIPVPHPHWSTLDANLKPLVMEIGGKLRLGMLQADKHLREITSAIRLPVAAFSHVERNSNQSRPIIHWSYDEQDLQDLEETLKSLEADIRQRVSRGLQIPLPSPFEGRQVHVTPEHIQQLRERLQTDTEILLLPSNSLMSVAWNSFTKYSFNSATIVLTTAYETFLKWKLVQDSEDITRYLIDNMPSPMLPKLLAATREYKNLDVPDKFKKWSTSLMEARNRCVHKPSEHTIHWFEFARWYAMVESVIGASNGAEISDFIGEFVELTSQDIPEINGRRGVVLRWETDYGDQTSFHVMLTDSTTIRAQENVLAIIPSLT